MQIRDTRNGSWYWVNTAVNACPHITPIDKTVYAALCTFAGCAEIRPSYPEISKRSAISVRRCKESVQKLIKRGYVCVEKGGGKGNANIYTLLKVPKGCGLCTLSNGANNDTQTVRITTSNGADYAPHIDKEVDKELNTISDEIGESQVIPCDDDGKPLKEKKLRKQNKDGSFGNPDINECVSCLKEKLGGSLDGGIAINRRFAKLLLDKFHKDFPAHKPVDLVKRLIDAASADSFHAKNATGFKYLYFNAQKIIMSAKNKKSLLIQI